MTDETRKHGGSWLFVAVCILGTIWIEYVMIHEQSYTDWSNIVVAIQTYIIITCLTMLIYFIMFRRKFRDVVAMTMMYVVLIVIPIGTIIAVRGGYIIGSQLLNINWLFTHDFFYIVMVCQAVLTWILLLALTKPIPKRWNNHEKEDIYEGGEGGFANE